MISINPKQMIATGCTSNMNNYDIWKSNKCYGDNFFDRSTGKTEEMESSKAICKILQPFYRKRMTILDVGCGAGHYLRSLQKRLDPLVDYVGTDMTSYYIEKAKEAFPDTLFFIDDIHNLKFEDGGFDIVICNNVICHLPSPPKKAISELLRVSSDYMIIRIPCSERNYIIKEVRDKGDKMEIKLPKNQSNLIRDNGEPISWSYLNLYTVDYIKSIIMDNDINVEIDVVDDTYWNHLNSKFDSPTGTTVIEGKQVSGSIVLDWKFFVIKKNGRR